MPPPTFKSADRPNVTCGTTEGVFRATPAVPVMPALPRDGKARDWTRGRCGVAAGLYILCHAVAPDHRAAALSYLFWRRRPGHGYGREPDRSQPPGRNALNGSW